MSMMRRLRGALWFRQLFGRLMALYLKLVWKTSRFVLEPADSYALIEPHLPVIVTMWHGQHFLLPFLRRPHDRVKVLISLHHDADINAIAAEQLGVGIIRGSGDHGGDFKRKGGVRAFIQMRRALEEGWTVAVTADVPKVARIAGKGLIMLAATSERRIYPVGIATSRRVTLRNWDRTAINLPFSRGAMVIGEPVDVPASAEDEMIEDCRRRVEASLNAASTRAYAIVDASEENASRA